MTTPAERAYQQRYYQAHRETFLARRREYYQLHREDFRRRGREHYARHAEDIKAQRLRYYAANPEKLAAHNAVAKAIRQGDMVPPTECSNCGRSGAVRGHHKDYSKPLDVTWLCGSCHMHLHDPFGQLIKK